MSPGIKSQTILTISYIKGSKVSQRKSWGDVFTRFCIDFAGKLTSFESLWGNVWPSWGHRKANKWPWCQISNNSYYLMCKSLKSESVEPLRWGFGRFCINFLGKWPYFESPWSDISPPRGHRKAIVWPLVSKTKRFLAIQCLKWPEPEIQAL